ncbi:hypothetical protein BKA62DRAFT_740983 [Auriculariales sp. MPI-PUGE-AT-0066]|nr:hypothetical protein BKA62DRAFT_740983 [Auriculariales sp. MPI-PUGE-AT-0066]
MPTLDPLLSNGSGDGTYGIPQKLPSGYPPSVWRAEESRMTLASMCRVNKEWHEAARPWLWRRVEVTLPHAWLALVDQVAGPESDAEGDDDAELVADAAITIDQTLRAALPACPEDRELELLHASLKAFGFPNGSIPPELLSPPASREPSPARPKLRAKSPGRWRLFRTVTDAVQNVLARAEPVFMVPAVPLPRDNHPGIHVRHLDFTHFRTIGMRRSIGEGVSGRFVTSDRLLRLLKEMPNLSAFGATEYMDGALTLPVLAEILFRGLNGEDEDSGRGRTSRRDAELDPTPDADADDLDRRRECRPIEALDLCGCVSAVFVNALDELVRTNISPENNKVSSIPGLRRLGLRGLASISSRTLTSLVLACPNLTHLDLSGTRCGPELIESLALSDTMSLTALSIGRCVRLSGEIIANLLVESPVVASLKQLSVYGDATFPSPFDTFDLDHIIKEAPCFLSGELEYLDLSSAPITAEHLDLLVTQPALRSLGLSHILDLPLPAVASFLETRAPNVEVLCLVNSTPELAGHGATKREINMSLHCQLVQPLCMPPFRITGWGGATATHDLPTAATKLRVIELGMGTLSALHGTVVNAWRVVRSKGGRAWYVDAASGWVDGRLRRELGEGHVLRREIVKLADANGNVSSGVGWHARKMEILQGTGMLGREDGLYGAVSFAYQG